MSSDHVDVLIVGAGLSGIGAACHLQMRRPGTSYAIAEARGASGGTWDLFRYPGVRSDSDMYTLGYAFKPWTDPQAIADGPAILRYIRETAREYDVDRHIRYHHRVVAVSWSTPDARWTVELERTDTGETVRMTARFLYVCGGYYRYDEGFTPEFPGADGFQGQIIHPQHWPEELDYDGKRVVVIGSGATAVTVVPAMAERAQHVTMLQRSPTYIVSVPGQDKVANGLRRVLPAKAAYGITRWKNVGLITFQYQLSRRAPGLMKRLLRLGVKQRLPDGYDVDKHFTPSYQPWDQRLCLVPRGDLFRAIRKEQASVVTDHIERFDESGIVLRSGGRLDADIIVTATGLNLLPFAGLQLTVDGEAVDITTRLTYKSMMLEGVPNFAFGIGYTNASWTLKVDLTSAYVCRLLRHMDSTSTTICVPRNHDASITPEPLLDFQSGYVQRSLHLFPSQGSAAPWKLRQNYWFDLAALKRGDVEDGAMEFSGPAAAPAPREPVVA